MNFIEEVKMCNVYLGKPRILNINPTLHGPVLVFLLADHEEDEGDDHADERDQVAVVVADLLLHVRHTRVRHHRARVDEPVEPDTDVRVSLLQLGHFVFKLSNIPVKINISFSVYQ